jgi:hypothetical protein
LLQALANRCHSTGPHPLSRSDPDAAASRVKSRDVVYEVVV